MAKSKTPKSTTPKFTTVSTDGAPAPALRGIDPPKIDPRRHGGTGDMPGLDPQTDWSRPK